MAYEYRTSFTAADRADREETIVDGRFSSDGSQYLADSEKINLGTDEDFQIYHDGDNGYITNTKGEFQIGNSGTGNVVFIQPKVGENSIKAVHNGSVSLYWGGAGPKFETTENGGVAITGPTNGEQATFGGASSGLKISTWQKTNDDAGVTISAEHSSNGTLAFNTAGTERLRITKDGYLRYSGSNNTDETNKVGRILARSHDTNEEDVLYFNMEQEDSMNQLTIGGGSASYNAATKIIFRTAAIDTVTGENRLEINSDGNATFSGIINLGADKGIMFHPHDQSATEGGSDSNLLNDYEEGNFTPNYKTGAAATNTLSAANYTTTTGLYTKIGDIVHFQLRLKCSSATAESGQIVIEGLPESQISTNAQSGAYIVASEMLSASNNARLIIDGSSIVFQNLAGAALNSDTANLDFTKEFHCAGFYKTA